jgi:hypothetical protein
LLTSPARKPPSQPSCAASPKVPECSMSNTGVCADPSLQATHQENLDPVNHLSWRQILHATSYYPLSVFAKQSQQYPSFFDTIFCSYLAQKKLFPLKQTCLVQHAPFQGGVMCSKESHLLDHARPCAAACRGSRHAMFYLIKGVCTCMPLIICSTA